MSTNSHEARQPEDNHRQPQDKTRQHKAKQPEATEDNDKTTTRPPLHKKTTRQDKATQHNHKTKQENHKTKQDKTRQHKRRQQRKTPRRDKITLQCPALPCTHEESGGINEEDPVFIFVLASTMGILSLATRREQNKKKNKTRKGENKKRRERGTKI